MTVIEEYHLFFTVQEKQTNKPVSSLLLLPDAEMPQKHGLPVKVSGHMSDLVLNSAIMTDHILTPRFSKFSPDCSPFDMGFI